MSPVVALRRVQRKPSHQRTFLPKPTKNGCYQCKQIREQDGLESGPGHRIARLAPGMGTPQEVGGNGAAGRPVVEMDHHMCKVYTLWPMLRPMN